MGKWKKKPGNGEKSWDNVLLEEQKMPEVDGLFWQKVLQSGNNCVTIIFKKRDFGCCTFPMRD